MIFLINGLIAKTINSSCGVHHRLILEFLAIFLSFEIFMVINTEITHANRGAGCPFGPRNRLEFAEEGGAWCVSVMGLFFLG